MFILFKKKRKFYDKSIKIIVSQTCLFEFSSFEIRLHIIVAFNVNVCINMNASEINEMIHNLHK